MCVSFTNKGKTQVKYTTVIGEKAWKLISANDTPPKGSPYCVPNSNEMTVKSLCLEAFKKCSGNGHA
jgi:hypothetical protein